MVPTTKRPTTAARLGAPRTPIVSKLRFQERCNVRKSRRPGSPICMLESRHKGDHWGYAGNGVPKWWEG